MINISPFQVVSYATQSKTSEFLKVPFLVIIHVALTNPYNLVFLSSSTLLPLGAPKRAPFSLFGVPDPNGLITLSRFGDK